VTRWRLRLTTALGVIAPLLLLFATVSTWVHFDVLASDALGEHARRALQEPAVRDELAAQITRRVAESDPRLAAAQPVVRRAADILISSRQFADIVDIALQQVRRSVLEGREVSGTRLGDIEDQLRQTLEAVDPAIAARVPRNWDTGLIDLTTDAPLPRAFRAAEDIDRFWWLGCVAAALSLIGWVASAYNRRRTITAVGGAFALVGVTLVVGRQLAGRAVEGRVDGDPARGATRAAFDVTTHGLHQIGVACLLVAAIVLAATLTGSLVPTLARRSHEWFRRLVRLPEGPMGRLAWALGAVAVGLGLALASPRVGPAFAIAAGVGVAFTGVRVLVAALPSQPLAPRSRAPRLALALGAVVVALAAATVFDRGGDRATGSAETQNLLVCNGHAELCDRRVDEVTFGGTHNSMAAANAGFAFAEQTGTIREQLDQGARVLMLDTHYGIPTSEGLVLTDLVFSDREALVRRYGEETVGSIERLRQTVVPTSSAPSVYLCHSFCELGATQARSAFGDIRQFLAENPSEVMVLIIQDETEAADTVRALSAAGLDDLAYAKPVGEPWPTLGDLVRNGTPLIVFSQREGGEPPWFMPAFSLVQDNPYRATSIDDLSCDFNRGPTDASIFLLNHWISKQSPDRGDAAQINDRTFLLDQVRRCEEERGQRVNLIAVDFLEEGGLVAAVDELNLGAPE
jgi:hypothetical protein